MIYRKFRDRPCFRSESLFTVNATINPRPEPGGKAVEINPDFHSSPNNYRHEGHATSRAPGQ